MKNQSLSILFVIKLNKKNKKGMCPLNVRITYLKKRKEASSGIMVNPLEWHSKQQKITSKTTSGRQLNQHLEIQVSAIRKAYLQLQLGSVDFTVDDIWGMFIGKVEKKNENMISYFEKFLVKQSKLIGKDLKLSTWKKSEYVCHDVKAFIESGYGKKDYPLNKLDQSFLDDFEFFLKSPCNKGLKGCYHNSINTIDQQVWKRYCHQKGISRYVNGQELKPCFLIGWSVFPECSEKFFWGFGHNKCRFVLVQL